MSESYERLDQAVPTRAPCADLPRIHVLIVDDDDFARRLCAGYCDLFDFTWSVARNAADGMAAVRRERFDVVVTSLGMSDHADLIWRCRDQAPVVGLTPLGQGDEAQRWLAAGLSGVVAKPVTAARLFSALSTAAEPCPDPRRSWAPV